MSDVESHHLIHVMRAKAGQEIELFSGSGEVAAAEIVAINRKTVTVSVNEVETEPDNEFKLTLAVACPKGDRLTYLVEKATELGVNALHPLLTSRTVVNPGLKKIGRLENVVISACKQSGRNHLMKIHAPISWESFLESSADGQILVADPHGTSLLQPSTSRQIDQTLSISVAVGPEGGFTNAELQLAKTQGAQFFGLSKHILRVETASIAAASLILAIHSAGAHDD